MIKVRLFGRCRIYHDPVSPVLRAPAQIGWDAWFRSIDLVTPQPLKGEELLRRTRGWWTVEPEEVAALVEKYGKLMVGEGGELMVAFVDEQSLAISGRPYPIFSATRYCWRHNPDKRNHFQISR